MKKIAIIFGGCSVEHEISLISTKNIISAIDKKDYEILSVGISKDGTFFLFKGENYLLNPDDPEKISMDLSQGEPIVFIPGNGEIFNLKSQEKIKIDITFPVLHGINGEDGSVQGMLQLSNIPFVGADILGSALGMDKEFSKILMENQGIQVAKYLVYKDVDKDKIDFNNLVKDLGLPFYIKPANTGSSVGISRVNNIEEFDNAVKEAFLYDQKIIIEEEIKGREIECSVLGNGHPVASLPGEVVPKNHFYSYEAKYLDKNGAQFNIPLKIDEEIIQKIQKTSILAYQALGIESMARVDGFLTSDNEYYINELNTIPGFTSISMYPKLWEVSGLPLEKLIKKLIDIAFERFLQQQKLKSSIK